MANLKDVMAYIITNYPSHMDSELSNARLTKMVYLADWKNCIDSGSQITSINWYFDNYGPFVRDIEQEAKNNSGLFEIAVTNNVYGSMKKIFKLKYPYEANLSPVEKKSIDHVISETSKLYWAPFIRLVYSTFPITQSDRYQFVDLVALSKSYKELSELV